MMKFNKVVRRGIGLGVILFIIILVYSRGLITRDGTRGQGMAS